MQEVTIYWNQTIEHKLTIKGEENEINNIVEVLDGNYDTLSNYLEFSSCAVLSAQGTEYDLIEYDVEECLK